MGLPFPSGRFIEEEALKNNKPIPKKKISKSGMNVNLSGLENMAVKLYEETNDIPLVSAFVLDYVGRAVIAMIDAYTETYGKAPFVCAGGVMCNSIIKGMISGHSEAYFAEPLMSADNAVGIAALTKRAIEA